MPSMRAVLETRQKAAAAQVKQLEAELERVRAALADAEEVHRHRVIGLEQYRRVNRSWWTTTACPVARSASF